MFSGAASLLDQGRWSERWVGHLGLHTAQDYALCKFIDCSYMREQINLCWMMSTGQKQLDPRLDPRVKPFLPANHQEKDQNLQTKNSEGSETAPNDSNNNNVPNKTTETLEEQNSTKIKMQKENNE